MPVTISCPQLADLANRMTAAAQDLGAALAPASGNIAASLLGEVALRYKGRAAQGWQSETNTLGGAASVHVWATNPITFYWEFGTRAHAIDARNARALRFVTGGATVFRRHVQHPGTPEHNQRDALTQVLAMTAAIEWRTAISTLLQEA